jgi:hypothetical protein
MDEFPDWNGNLPELPAYPEDPEGWRGLNAKLISRCHDLPNKIKAGQRAIESRCEHSQELGGEIIVIEAAVIGIAEWEIAADLRKAYGLGKSGLDRNYVSEFREWSRQAKAKMEGSRLKKASHHRLWRWVRVG